MGQGGGEGWWWSGVGASGWLAHVQRLLSAALLLAQLLLLPADQATPVLLHGGGDE